MVARIPLVLVGGLIAELPASDTLLANVSEVDVISMVNKEVAPITKTQAVYVSAAGEVMLANANVPAQAKVIGLVADASIAADASGAIQTDGLINGFTGLTPGAPQFLDTTDGALTETPPAGAGNSVVRLGRAISTTEVVLQIDYPNLLA